MPASLLGTWISEILISEVLIDVVPAALCRLDLVWHGECQAMPVRGCIAYGCPWNAHPTAAAAAVV